MLPSPNVPTGVVPSPSFLNLFNPFFPTQHLNEKLSKSQIKKMKDKFDKTGKLPPHLQKLAKLMDKHTELKNVVVPGLEWMADLDEGWSKKYKKSIDCSNPKGFSQKAHCAGKKKRQENVMNISKEKLKEMIREEYNNILSESEMMTEEQFNELGYSVRLVEPKKR